MVTALGSPPSMDGPTRKKIKKACDRCRSKKSKCDGGSPCSKCRACNAVCVFGERRKIQEKVHANGYAELLETQQYVLVVGLQELYRRLITGLGWVGPPIKQNRDGVPLAHDILERLGALSHSSQSGDEAAEGALNVPEQNSTTNGPRSINSSETNQCSPYEPVARTKICRNTFPTDPLQLSSLDEGTYLDTTASTDSNPFLCTFDYQDDFRWTTLPPETGNEMQFFNHYDTATLGTDIDFVSFDPNPLQQPIA